MSILEILEYPDPRLRNKALPVAKVTPEIQGIVDDMFDTLYADHGVGLAAIQVDIRHRIIVVDFSDDKSGQLVLINPEIIEYRDTMQHAEGCLSVPGLFDNIERHKWIKVRYLDRNGKQQELETEGESGCSNVAGCIQHEMDHLDGKLFVDYLSKLKRERILKKLEKQQKQRM